MSHMETCGPRRQLMYCCSMKVGLTLGCVLAALCFAGQARAVRCVPSGNSAIGQYVDPLPGPGCNQAPGTGTTPPGGGAGAQGSAPGSSLRGTTGSAGTTLRPAAVRAFAAHGLAGRAVARLIAATAPPGAGNGGNPGVFLRMTHSQSPFAAAVSATTTAVSGGAGLALVIFAAITLTAVLARIAWQRWRSGG